MAERRMFAKNIILLGDFQAVSHWPQLLYLYLNMYADDDGFVGNPKAVMHLVRAGKKSLQDLVDIGLVLQFPSGVVAITHWHIHNQIRKDRYKRTIHQKELSQLCRDQMGAYRWLTDNQTVATVATQDRIGKDRLGKDREGKKNTGDQVVSPEGLSSSSYKDFESMVLGIYQKHCGKLVECKYLDEGIRKQLQSLEQGGWTEDALEDAFRIAGECAFLQGENGRHWKADLEWLSREDNLRKVCSGKYRAYAAKEDAPCGAAGDLGQAELEAIQKLLQEEQ